MKRTNAPPIPESLRIVLNGEEQEWKDVMQVFEDAEWVWISGIKPLQKETCAYTKIETWKDKKIAYCSDRPIITELTAAQFLQQYSTYPVNTRIRPATSEEIASVTKVVPKEPELYIWDGDVLPDEYWVENPWFGKDKTEFVSLFNGMGKGNDIGGTSRWYRIKDSRYQECHKNSNPNTELPIVLYELWKSILEQPDPQADPVTERMFKKGDRVKVVKGIYEGCLGVIADVGIDSLYWADLDSGDKNVILFSGETGTRIDIVHHKDEPAVSKWSIVTTDGVTVYEGDLVWWYYIETKQLGLQGKSFGITNNHTGIGTVWLLFSTFEAAEEYISKQKQLAGRKWKVGDMFTVANDSTVYTIANNRGERDENIEIQWKNGTESCYYSETKVDELWGEVWVPYSENKEKNDNTTTINQTNNQTTNNDNNKQQPQQDSCISNIENSRYPGTALDLRADQERISTGSRSTGTSLRCTGQPEYIASKYSSYPKGSGYCEEV